MSNVEKYIDAHQTLAALKQAEKDDGQPRTAPIRLAMANVKIAYSKLTGSQIGALRRQGLLQ